MQIGADPAEVRRSFMQGRERDKGDVKSLRVNLARDVRSYYVNVTE